MAVNDLTRLAVVDVETTGLSPGRDRVLEIAVVIVEPTGQIVFEYETLVNPNRDVGPTRIHGITSEILLKAPTFDEIAGDLLSILSSVHVIAGHNISFDRSFIATEYGRIGVDLPDFEALCTCQNMGRTSLSACCAEYGIDFDHGMHQAIYDARATAKLLACLYRDTPAIVERHHTGQVEWPSLARRNTACVSREQSKILLREPSSFLQRLAERIHHDVDTEPANVLAYLALIDRVLEDRAIDPREENILIDAASSWNLTQDQLVKAHRDYVYNLAVLALSDGILGEAERSDLHLIARILGQNEVDLDRLLELAAVQLSALQQTSTGPRSNDKLVGSRVCFTGELGSTIQGKPITREIAEAFAEKAGLIVSSSVTKKLDVLVVADPNTQSGKAKKAREYGTRILADTVFWKLIGVAVD